MANPGRLQLIQAIAQEYIQHKQLGASFPDPHPHAQGSPPQLPFLPPTLWGGGWQIKRRGVQFSNSNNRSSFGAWVERSRQRSPRDGRKGWGAPFSSVGSTSAFVSGQFAGIRLGCRYVWLWRRQVRNRMEVESAFPLIFTR